MAGVGLLLLIVCLNVSHLLLARGIKRERELGIRAALGASGPRVVRQLLAEGLLLAAGGGLAGALASHWLIDGLLLLAVDERAQQVLRTGPDARLLSFTALLALAIAGLLGLVPAWRAT